MDAEKYFLVQARIANSILSLGFYRSLKEAQKLFNRLHQTNNVSDIYITQVFGPLDDFENGVPMHLVESFDVLK